MVLNSCRWLLFLLCRLADGEDYGDLLEKDENGESQQTYLELVASFLRNVFDRYPDLGK